MPLADLLQEPVTDPAALYRFRDGLLAIDLLSAAAVHLDLFTWLADHPSTPGAICAQFGLQARPADVLLTLSTALGLTTQAGGVFHLTLRGREHFSSHSPFSLLPYYGSLRERAQTKEMLAVLRTGRPAHWAGHEPDEWARAMERPEFAAGFTAAMDCRGVLLGAPLAREAPLEEAKRLLDIGGGSGIYACALAARFPHLQATVYEKPPVDGLAREAIARRGGTEQVAVLPGDMLEEDLPPGFDAHLFSNVLHDWAEEVVRLLLRKSFASLPPGGLLLIHDAHLNPEKTGPLPVAQYSVLLMHSTQGKCYSTGEMRSLFREIGFEWVSQKPTALEHSLILARKPE